MPAGLSARRRAGQSHFGFGRQHMLALRVAAERASRPTLLAATSAPRASPARLSATPSPAAYAYHEHVAADSRGDTARSILIFSLFRAPTRIIVTHDISRRRGETILEIHLPEEVS